MKRGFTLLELVVVIVIIGILATLGIQQYFRMIERSRGAEARAILGTIRSLAAAHRLDRGNLNAFNDADAGIGAGLPGPALGDCGGTHYFAYDVVKPTTTGNILQARALRCEGASGKNPPGVAAGSNFILVLDTNFATGADAFTGPY
ncbi:MAG: prepilin-type N-terminal cleavage/methylation domain-containing protein [Candidatus Omnitrophota bacterium]|nr:MAG: prepilin-type N-terminal cleavage/methylation domain-containing protein [Candidatus Omnitrophota bacterium]